jgi:hypothetical protein
VAETGWHLVSVAVAVVEGPAEEAAVMPTLMAINPVIAERADDFEDLLRTIVIPAVREYRPELEERWEVLRATEEEDGTVIFTFILRGGDASDWRLEPLLDQALGPERAHRVISIMSGMMKREQYGWIMTPVQL